MPRYDFQSLFTDQPQRQPSGGLGAEPEWRIKPTSFAEDDADPRFPAFQQAWKQGAGLSDLFGPDPFQLHGTVAPSGGDNTRPDVAKVQTLLGRAGYVGIRDGGPNGYPSDMLDGAIRQFQQDKGLKVDGVLKPGGPTITALGGLLGGGEKQSQIPSGRYPMDEKPGGRDPWDIQTPPTFPAPKPKPQPTGNTQDSDLEALIRIMTGGKAPESRPQPQPTPPRLPPIGDDLPEDGGYIGTLPRPHDEDRLRGHTINQDGIDSNQGYAEMLVRDSDPSQTARMLKRTIDEYGNQGRGDVADLLGRFQKVDAGKAEALRREIHKATGEMLPYRIAPLGEGFREPTEEDRIAAAPKVPFGSAQGADRWAAGNMADALLGRGDYAEAIPHFQGEIGKNRDAAMPYLAAVHEIMGDKNPGLAAKFATQMQKAGLTEEKKPEPAPEPAPAPTPAPAPAPTPTPEQKPEAPQPEPSKPQEAPAQTNPEPKGYPQPGSNEQGKPTPSSNPDLKPEHQATRQTLENVRDRGKLLGQDKASELLDHYLKGDGSAVTLDHDWVREHPPVKEAEARDEKHFENWLVGKGPADSKSKTIETQIPRDGEAVEINGLKWEAAADSPAWKFWDDRNNALGGLSVKGVGNLKLERKGDEVIVTGTVNQHAEDTYDFAKKGRNDWLPQGVLGGDFTLDRQRINDMEKADGAKPFTVNTSPWTKNITGVLKLDKDGKVTGSHFEWKR